MHYLVELLRPFYSEKSGHTLILTWSSCFDPIVLRRDIIQTGASRIMEQFNTAFCMQHGCEKAAFPNSSRTTYYEAKLSLPTFASPGL